MHRKKAVQILKKLKVNVSSINVEYKLRFYKNDLSILYECLITLEINLIINILININLH